MRKEVKAWADKGKAPPKKKKMKPVFKVEKVMRQATIEEIVAADNQQRRPIDSPSSNQSQCKSSKTLAL